VSPVKYELGCYIPEYDILDSHFPWKPQILNNFHAFVKQSLVIIVIVRT
jgi:hypothetical protein